MNPTLLSQCEAQLLIPTGSTQSTAFQDTCKINHLWRLALGIYPVDANLSRKYIQELLATAKTSTIDVHFIQSCFCGNCQLLFVPGVTCQVAQHKRSLSSQAHKRAARIAKNKHVETSEIAPFSEMVYTCTSCGCTTSICNSTRKQEGEKKARATSKKKKTQKRTSPATIDPLALQSSTAKKIKLRHVAPGASVLPAAMPTSIISMAPRRKKKKKKQENGSLGSFVNKL